MERYVSNLILILKATSNFADWTTGWYLTTYNGSPATCTYFCYAVIPSFQTVILLIHILSFALLQPAIVTRLVQS